MCDCTWASVLLHVHGVQGSRSPVWSLLEDGGVVCHELIMAGCPASNAGDGIRSRFVPCMLLQGR